MEGMWSLIFFTLLVQASSGMVILQAIFGGEKAQNKLCWAHCALGLALAGTVFSLLHLSAPMHSVFTINNIFFSWLSREIFCVGLFTAALCYYLYTQEKIYLWLTAVAGVVLNYAMSNIYSMSQVPFWQEICVFGAFLLTAGVLGGTTLLALGYFCRKDPLPQRLKELMTSWLPLTLSVLLALRMGFAVDQTAHAVTAMSIFALYASPVLLGLGMALLFFLLQQSFTFCPKTQDREARLASGMWTLCMIALLVCMVGGEILARVTFYQGYTWFGM